ncbi:dTDP-glucose 4,6-dehydratase [Flavobacterium fryxellicola]|nr:dTDP-glucose 4,6-dehydratase [Flavobacterium fryxellicola]
MCVDGIFTETTAYDLNSTYFAAKASSNHFVRAYGETFARPFVLTNCSNNYGPNHFLEKLIPRFINNIININPLPVYGDGNYTRDWFFVEDPAVAIDLVFHDGNNHETYNISGFDECKNIHSVQLLCQIMNRKLVRSIGTSAKLIIYLKDRPGHDLTCATGASKINKELVWKPSVTLEQSLEKTIDWYLYNKKWLHIVTSGDYQKFYEKQYN